MSEHSLIVSIPQRWIVGVCALGAVLGFGAAFIVGPVVGWLLGAAGDAPAPLRLAAGLPLLWAIPVLTLVGCGVGLWIAMEWQKDIGTLEVSPEGVTVHRVGGARYLSRDRIDGVFTDGKDLVCIDAQTNESLRIKTDRVVESQLREAFEHFGYTWRGTADPYEQSFTAWIDGSGPLDARAHDLLRARQRALADKRPGAADDALDELRGLGIAVRDRGGAQQFRLISRGVAD